MITNTKSAFFKVVVLSTMLIFAACTSNDFFNEYKSLSDGWKKSEAVVFSFESLDTITKHNAYINIRTKSDYPYSNLFLIVKIFPPEGAATVDTLQYQMANANGTMLGTGFTDIKEHKLYWRKNLGFNVQGVYKIEIEHAIRKVNEVKGDAVLNGITEVGLQLQ